MFAIFLSFMTAFTLAYIAIPHIINIARDRNLCVEPGERSSHTISTPALGGIGIFSAAVFSIVMWTPFSEFADLQYLLCAFIIVFLMGVKDDFAPLDPVNKIIGQALASCILIFKSDVLLRGFYGVGYLHNVLPQPVMIALTLFAMLVIINAFNLIDGINGLAGSLGALIAGTLGCWFYWVGSIELAVVSFSIVGAVLAFLKYNYTPAKIFMGDSGSLLIGTSCAILIIQFVDMNYYLAPSDVQRVEAVPAVAIGIMIIPLFDTIWVSIHRIIRNKSPFSGDRRHIHHLLIDSGFSHMQATGILVAVNAVFILLAFTFNHSLDLHLLLGLILGLATLLTYLLHRMVAARRRRKKLV